MLVLASRSPRRRALLRAAGVAFRAVAPVIQDEVPPGRVSHPADYAQRAALAKVRDVASRLRPALPVLAADTVVVCAEEVLGKPANQADAKRMLGLLSGRRHYVYTGVALVEGQRRLLGVERTEVEFRKLSKEEIEWYVATGEPMGKAGAYAIQGHGAALIGRIRGCYTNVIGLPLPKVMAMLAELEGEESNALPPR